MVTVMVIFGTSCSKDFLERNPSTALSNATALTNLSGCEAAVVGTMSQFTSSAYTGRDLTVIGDLATDNVSTTRQNAGHLLDIERWNITPSLGEVKNIWIASYSIIASSTKIIQASKKLIAEDSKKDEKKSLNTCVAAALSMKAYAEFILTQYYCLPYNENRKGNVGIILVGETPITKDEAVSASTLEETYNHILAELKEAIQLFNENSKAFSSSSSQYFPTLCMAYTLQARVYQSQGKQRLAAEAADNALKNLPAGTLPTLTKDIAQYYGNYMKPTITPEDIWTINYTTQDNLSANSINNMYGSYGASISVPLLKLFRGTDIRKALYPDALSNDEKRPVYSFCLKFPAKDLINNVPVFRVPELYLIRAEAYANPKGDCFDENAAKTELLKVIGARDTTIKTVADIDAKYMISGKSVLNVVLDERRREFACEGHRWFDMRRNDITLNHPNDESISGSSAKSAFRISFTGYKIFNFAFPVPESETNTGAWQKGNRKQNEAWKTSGNTYAPVDQLPYDQASF